jgi:hypothetical protein
LKFEPEIMREQLLAVEGLEAGKRFQGFFHFDEYPDAVSIEHTRILIDERYLYGETRKNHRDMPFGSCSCFALAFAPL